MKSYVKPQIAITELRAEEGIACFGSPMKHEKDNHSDKNHGKPNKKGGGKSGWGWGWGSFFPW